MPRIEPLPPVPGLRLPQDVADLVAADQQPRQATADDGSEHMLFWDGSKVRSVPVEQWAAMQQELAGKAAAAARADQRRQTVRAKAQAHAGKRADQLSLPEMRDILLMFLEERGALADDLTIKDVEAWG